MAFMIYQTEDGRVPAWEYYDATGLTPKVGMALKLSSGKLVLSTGATAPQFICMRSQDTAVVAGDAPIPVVQVNDGVTFEVATSATLAVGAAVAVGTDGLTVVSNADGQGVVVAAPETGYVRVRFK